MKALNYTSIFILFCFLSSECSYARNIDDILALREQEKPRYILMTDLYFLDALVLSMNYGDSYIVDDVDKQILRKADVKMIDLVFTDFPKGADLKELNKKRIQVVKNIRKTLISDESIRWRIIRQTACKNEAEAKTLFHGIVIHYKGDQTEDERLEEYSRMLSFLPETIVSEKEAKKLLSDSTIIKILDRNKKWENIVITADLTGSMYPYTQQLVLWFKLRLKDKRVKDLIFFNDGDDKIEKNIGFTGGVYHEKAKDYETARLLALKTMANGGGR